MSAGTSGSTPAPRTDSNHWILLIAVLVVIGGLGIAKGGLSQPPQIVKLGFSLLFIGMVLGFGFKMLHDIASGANQLNGQTLGALALIGIGVLAIGFIATPVHLMKQIQEGIALFPEPSSPTAFHPEAPEIDPSADAIDPAKYEVMKITPPVAANSKRVVVWLDLDSADTAKGIAIPKKRLPRQNGEGSRTWYYDENGAESFMVRFK